MDFMRNSKGESTNSLRNTICPRDSFQGKDRNSPIRQSLKDA
jgi:hypothetical protein